MLKSSTYPWPIFWKGFKHIMVTPKQCLNVPKHELGTCQIQLEILKLVGAKNILFCTVVTQVTIQDFNYPFPKILKKWDTLCDNIFQFYCGIFISLSQLAGTIFDAILFLHFNSNLLAQ